MTDASLVMSSTRVGGQLIHLSAAVRQSRSLGVLRREGAGGVKVAKGGWVLSGHITVRCVGGGAVEGVVHLVNPY